MKIRLAFVGLLALLAAGCGPEDYGYPAPEKYATPAPIEYTEGEQGVLDIINGAGTEAAQSLTKSMLPDQRAALAPLVSNARSLLAKIMLERDAYRATVLKHNELAEKSFQKMCDKSGYKVQSATLAPQQKF